MLFPIPQPILFSITQTRPPTLQTLPQTQILFTKPQNTVHIQRIPPGRENNEAETTSETYEALLKARREIDEELRSRRGAEVVETIIESLGYSRGV